MKRAFSAMLAVIIMIIIVTALSPSSSVVFAAGDIIILVDGGELKTDVPPKIINGRTMVPVRAVSEAVGCYVEWIGEERCVMIYSPEHCPDGPYIVMYIDNPIVNVYENSERPGYPTANNVTIDSPPIVVDGRTLVPLRFIAESLDFGVEWDEDTNTVYISAGAAEWGGIYKNDATGIVFEVQRMYFEGYAGDLWLDIFRLHDKQDMDDVHKVTHLNELNESIGYDIVRYGWIDVDGVNKFFANQDNINLLLDEYSGDIELYAGDNAEWAYLNGRYEKVAYSK